MKKIFIVGIITYILIALTCYCVAGFADFDDEAARKETEELIKEQEKASDEKQIIEKSDNNYLLSMSVEGHEIAPQFNKKILEYKIEDTVSEEEIKINVTLDDERAKVSGDGVVKLEQGENKLKIDVTSEKGTVRTYIVLLNCNKEENTEKTEVTNANTEVNQNNNQIENEKKQNNSVLIICIIGLVLLVIITFIVKNKKIYKKGKRMYK